MSNIKTDKAAKSKPSKGKRSGPESRLKVAVRRLPPNLPEGIFWESVLPWVDDKTTSWKVFYSGKLRPKGVNKENVYSRAYIAFTNEEQLKNFHRDYDGHLFRDKSGNESQAIVEYAPFQKIPIGKGKADQRQNTIQDDDDFKSFLASLNEVEPTEAEKLAMAPPPDPSLITTTPLLASLLPKETQGEKSAESRDKRQDARNADKTGSAKSRKRKEKDQKERKDDTEFSRAPPARQDTATAHPAEDQSKKGQSGKERSENSKKPNPPTKKPSEAGEAAAKAKDKVVPPSPVRSQRSKAPPASHTSQDTPGPSVAAGEGSSASAQQKARPKFKFDSILPSGGGRPRPNKSDSLNTNASVASPTAETTPSEAPNTSSRRGRKGKDKDKEPHTPLVVTGGAPHEPSSSKAAAHPDLPAKPGSPVVPRILQRPVARIDDEGVNPETPPQAGIIPIILPPRGRGRGGGRGRGRGRGRGGGPTTEN
ncbi:hypothetical protein FRB90_000060 [Tulasnella sp. 427]|nr:hypothetical protein FRB90_000060 [Tulasnella sp. 427]